MSYDVTWHIPDKVLLLTLSGDYTVGEAKAVNRLILDELNRSQTTPCILIDAMEIKRPHNFSDIRSAQTFMDHRRLKYIYVATNDNLVKLAMMVIFSLSRAYLFICEDVDKATNMAESQLVNLDHHP